ncbi:kinase-like domain-containing protein [Mycena polygramma]|nr:kinase-like domain-containing protein [Mycena polygramma]
MVDWDTYAESCSGFVTDTYFPSSVSLPKGTVIPFWAHTNPQTWNDWYFNVSQAQFLAQKREVDVAPRSTLIVSGSSDNKLRVGLIVGCIIGGLVVLATGVHLFNIRNKTLFARFKRGYMVQALITRPQIHSLPVYQFPARLRSPAMLVPELMPPVYAGGSPTTVGIRPSRALELPMPYDAFLPFEPESSNHLPINPPAEPSPAASSEPTAHVLQSATQRQWPVLPFHEIDCVDDLFRSSDHAEASIQPRTKECNSPNRAQPVPICRTSVKSDTNLELDNMEWYPGPWLELHQNFACYAVRRLRRYDGPIHKLLELSQQWAASDVLTSLGNYRSVAKILFEYVKVETPSDVSIALELSEQLRLDFSSLLQRTTSILRDAGTRKQFLGCRGTLAQQLLDLLQELLDSSDDRKSRPLLSKALLRLSRKCGFHPTCFALSGVKKMGHQIAGGAYGDIWKSVVDGQLVAIKSMRIFLEVDVDVALKQFGREAVIWRQLFHPNVLPFLGLFMLDNRLCLVSPWMENGHLHQFLRSASSDVDRIPIMLDVATGLNYLHSKGVVHGDLKAANILVTPSGRACIADFGLSFIVDRLSDQFTPYTTNARGGTARYQAPELLKGESLNHFGSDVYAFACVCYEIFTGKVPFFELPGNEIAVGIKVIEGHRPCRPKLIPDSLWTLLEDCWAQKQQDRPKMAQILQRFHGLSTPTKCEGRRSMADWDESHGARLRCSVQRWPPMLPSAGSIERYLSNDSVGAKVTTTGEDFDPPTPQWRLSRSVPV